MTTVSEALATIEAYTPRLLEAPGVRAAVAIAVEVTEDAATFLLTLRTGSLRAHAAQYALPGGRIDAGETPEAAVLREVEEEIGDADWRIVGRLDDYVTQSGYVVSPFVLLHTRGEATLRLGAAEVEAAYRIPIDGEFHLHEVGTHELSEGRMQLSLHEFDLFAPTGAILFQFLTLWATGRAPRVAHYGEPSFAAK